MFYRYAWHQHLNALSDTLRFASRICVILVAFSLPLSTALTNIFLLLAIVLNVLAGNWSAQYQLIARNRTAVLFLSFFALFVIGVFYSVAPFHDAFKMLLKYDKLIFAVLLLPLFVEVQVRRYAIYAFILAMILTMILSYSTTFGWLTLHGGLGAPAVFKGHIAASFLLAMAAYFFAYFYLNNKKYRWLWGVLFLIAVHNVLFLSMGRAGYVVFGALMMLLLWQHYGWKGLWSAIMIVTVLGCVTFFISNNFRTRLESIVSDVHAFSQGQDYSSVGLRLEFVQNSLKLIKERPILGYGTGSFTQEYATLKPKSGISTTNPHNEYLNVTVQLGLVGLLLLLCLFYVQWRDSRLLPRDMQCFVQAIIVAIAVGCFANSWLMDTTEGHFYIYFMALAFASLGQGEGMMDHIYVK